MKIVVEMHPTRYIYPLMYVYGVTKTMTGYNEQGEPIFAEQHHLLGNCPIETNMPEEAFAKCWNVEAAKDTFNRLVAVGRRNAAKGPAKGSREYYRQRRFTNAGSRQARSVVAR